MPCLVPKRVVPANKLLELLVKKLLLFFSCFFLSVKVVKHLQFEKNQQLPHAGHEMENIVQWIQASPTMWLHLQIHGFYISIRVQPQCRFFQTDSVKAKQVKKKEGILCQNIFIKNHSELRTVPQIRHTTAAATCRCQQVANITSFLWTRGS